MGQVQTVHLLFIITYLVVPNPLLAQPDDQTRPTDHSPKKHASYRSYRTTPRPATRTFYSKNTSHATPASKSTAIRQDWTSATTEESYSRDKRAILSHPPVERKRPHHPRATIPRAPANAGNGHFIDRPIQSSSLFPLFYLIGKALPDMASQNSQSPASPRGMAGMASMSRPIIQSMPDNRQQSFEEIYGPPENFLEIEVRRCPR